MIVVRVELWSAITGERTELARMHIANTGGGTAAVGDYRGETFIGRDAAALARQNVSRRGHVSGYPRQRAHVWNLVAKMLAGMGYR